MLPVATNGVYSWFAGSWLRPVGTLTPASLKSSRFLCRSRTSSGVGRRAEKMRTGIPAGNMGLELKPFPVTSEEPRCASRHS